MSSTAVLNLKKKALECRNAGDLEAAKSFLSQAKTIQALGESDDPASLKKLAVLLKQAGDLEGAKQALLKSKQLQQQEEQDEEQEQQDEEEVMEDPVNKAMDEATLQELNTVQFSNDEMLDVETMADMRASGMEIPSKQEYVERSMACKQRAVQAKQSGDIQAAKRYLLHYKQFEQAIQQLYGEEQQVSLEEEDDEEDYSLLDELYGDKQHSGDDEDYSLLDELYGDKQHSSEDDGFFEQLFGVESTAVELDDLDDLDPSMLRDMIDSGMQVPDVDEVLASAAEKKAAAIQFKKDGNLIAAKAALEESKRLTGRATQLSDMLQAMEACTTNNDDDNYQDMDPEAALEAMLRASEGNPKPQSSAPPAKQQEEPLKTSQEYKIEAVTHKRAGRLQEATAALRLYKQALAVEANAKAQAKRKECISLLEKEVVTAEEQSMQFCYFLRFVNREVGSAQVAAWKEYSRQCILTIDKLESGGEPMELERMKSSRLRIIQEESLAFIGQSIDPAEQRIEVAILEILGLETNKNLRQLLNTANANDDVVVPADGTIRVVVTVELPPSAEAPDDNTELEFKPQSRMGGSFAFGPSQFVNAERGSSRFAKLLTRRMNRKKIKINVYYVSSKKGLFSRSTKETLLGTAVVKLQDLLETTVIAGEFPLSDKSGKHTLGGLARVAVRTGTAFSESKDKKEEAKDIQVADTRPTPRLEHYAPFSIRELSPV